MQKYTQKKKILYKKRKFYYWQVWDLELSGVELNWEQETRQH